MSEMPDVDVGRTGTNQRIFIEIEFHPSEYKDIVKFLIGHNKQTLELGILIIAMNGETKKKINKNLSDEPIYLDEILEKAGIDHAKATKVLLDLELKKLITQLPGKQFNG